MTGVLCRDRYKEEYAEAIREIEAVKSEMEAVKQKVLYYAVLFESLHHAMLVFVARIGPCLWRLQVMRNLSFSIQQFCFRKKLIHTRLAGVCLVLRFEELMLVCSWKRIAAEI